LVSSNNESNIGPEENVVIILTSAVDSSGFSVLGRPLLFEPSSLSSDKDSPLRFRLREALAGVGLALIVVGAEDG
jgi:hypothetical protein